MPTVQANGIEMNYFSTGEGFPLVLAHGHSGNLRNWALQRSLAGRYRMISVDHRGHGKTTAPADPAQYSLEIMAEDLYQALRQLDVRECYLIGHSMGGMIALEFALAHQEMLRALVLVDTAPAQFGMHILQDVEEIERIARSQGLEAVFEYNLSRNPVMAMEIAKAPQNREIYKREYLVNNVDGYINSLKALRNRRPLTDRLGDIRVPTLLVVGDRDEPFIEPANTMHQGIPGSELVVIPECGHSPQIEFPDQFNKLLIEFFDRVEAGAGLAG
ncbi:MAG TPA: alpha/beta fold hydrolase [Dehalococcoidia bacterium]|nr:alpha/beta fold hydrolase [Dehalococcoidia bacterium]